MKLTSFGFGLFVCCAISAVHAENIDSLDWLSGEWIGEGQEGDKGEIEGTARLYWTPPLEGTMSLFFTWHAAETEHVHYAVSVFEQNENGIFGKGIHYGRDFENFEDNPWHLTATHVSSDTVVFRCLKHCRSSSVSFTLAEHGVLVERWTLDPKENKPDWIVTYRRVD